MRDSRFTFLQIFLTVLAVGFAIAVVARIRSYSAEHDGLMAASAEGSTVVGASATRARNTNATGSEVVVDDPTSPASRGSASARPASASSAALSREKRFKELLAMPNPIGAKASGTASVQAAPKPAPAPPPPPKPQSTVAKILQPITRFFSGSSGPSGGTSGTTSTTGTHGPAQQPKDPTTDTTPPQVTAIAFDPPQIADGDSSAVIITAIDDMSGVRGISGTVTSPTGKALQGFAAQRESEQSNRYIGRITIPKNAESGMWHINFLNISDNAANSAVLSYAQSPILQSAQLNVTAAAPDKTPPTLQGVWLDHRAMKSGEKNTLFVQATDDKSGVNLISGDFLSPTKNARIGFACRGGDNDVWQCDFTTPATVDCGDWQLEQLQLQDKASNLGVVHATDNQAVAAVKLNIMADSCDREAPTLQSVRLNPLVVASTPDGTFIDVEVVVTDDLSGVASVSAQVVGPTGGSGQFFPFSASGDPNTWTGRMPIPKFAGKGTWRINWLQVMDKANNLRIYNAGDPLLQNATVQVR